MSPGMRAVLFALACIGVVGLAWLTGHKAALDPGGYKDDVRQGWRWGDKFRHALGCMLTILVGFYGFGWGLAEPYWAVWLPTTVAIGWGAWVLVEVAQKWPRERYTIIDLDGVPRKGSRVTGRFALEDVAADTVGAFVAWVIVLSVSG